MSGGAAQRIMGNGSEAEMCGKCSLNLHLKLSSEIQDLWHGNNYGTDVVTDGVTVLKYCCCCFH